MAAGEAYRFPRRYRAEALCLFPRPTAIEAYRGSVSTLARSLLPHLLPRHPRGRPPVSWVRSSATKCPSRLGGEHKSPHHDGTRTGPWLTIARALQVMSVRL